jgi:hypothetical protein
MNDIEIYNQPLHLYDAKEYAREHGCSTPDDGAILYFKNEYPKGIDVDNDTSVYTYDKPIGKLVGHINNGDIYLVNGKNISYYCLVKNNFENEQSVKNTVKLNESQLRKIVAESVKKVLKEGYNQQIVDDAIQAILSIRKKVSDAATQVGFNPGQGNDEVSKLIKQISALMYRLDRTVNVDYYDSFYSGQD